MFTELNILLRDILKAEVTGLKTLPTPPGSAATQPVQDEQIGFAPPDQAWATDVKDMQLNALNVYLVDLRENRGLRLNQRVQTFRQGLVYEEPAPMRLDCHYLISAWSPTEFITPQVSPILDEQALLYETIAVLANHIPLNPSRIYSPGSVQLKAWEPYEQMDLPTQVAPADGFPKLAEFWSGMDRIPGGGQPCISL